MDQERKLAELAREGDRNAFEELVARYGKRIYHMAYSMLGERAAAEDICQEIWTKAYFSLPKFKGKSRFYTWLYRLAVNACLDEMRRRKRTQAISLEELGVKHQPEVQDPLVSEQMERLEMGQIAWKLLAELPAELRATIIFREIEGFDYNEIAQIMKVRVGTVRSRLFRARERLRENFRYHFEGGE
jgi:RNA polymerase sigma-70 factor (ECF subfamily)